MLRPPARLAALCLAAVALAVAAATASAAAPNLKQALLAPADIAPGAKVESDEPGDEAGDEYVARIERSFALGSGRVGSSALVALTQALTLYATPAEARDSVDSLVGTFRTPMIQELLGGGAGGKIKVTAVRTPKLGQTPRFTTARDVALGDQAFVLSMAVDNAALGQSIRVFTVTLRVGRVLVDVEVIGGKQVSGADALEIARRAAARAAVVR